MLLDDYLPPESNHNIDDQDMSKKLSLSDIPRDVTIQEEGFKLRRKKNSAHFGQKQLATPPKPEKLLGNKIDPVSVDSITSDESSSVSSGSPYVEIQNGQSERHNTNKRIPSDSIHEQLIQELKGLKEILKKKDEQIVQLMGQLGRATASKCDLVVACNDMERQKELAERYGRDVKTIVKFKHEYQKIVESRAELEQHYMNELAVLTEATCKMERRYLNIICEKDFEIAQLEESYRRLSAAESTDKQSTKRAT